MADNFYSKYSANEPASVVTSLNGLNGALTLAAGSGISITPSGSTLTIAASGGSGANTALSNLASVAVNTDLLPGVDNSIKLGSSSKRFSTIFSSAIVAVLGGQYIDVLNMQLARGTGIINFDWNSMLLGDASGITSVAWNSRTLNDTTGTSAGSWGNGFLTLVNGVVLTGSTSGTMGMRAAATTTPYSVFMPSAQGAADSYLKNDGSGNLTWSTVSGSGANTALSNLASVAFNADLVPGSNNTRDIGSSSAKIKNIHLQGVIAGDTSGFFPLIDVVNTKLYSTSGSVNLDWDAKTLLATTVCINWSNRTLNDNAGASCMTWGDGFIHAVHGFVLNGSSSGFIDFVAPAAVTDYTITYPAVQGAANTFLKNDGSGNLIWYAGASGSFTTVDLKTVTVVNGIITAIV